MAKNCRLSLITILMVPVLGLAFLGGCGGFQSEAVYPERTGNRVTPRPSKQRDTIFGPGGMNLLGSSDENSGGGGGSGIGVNGFLWRASLDTVAFMPLTSADPFGGVIITDWYSPPETPQERFKMTVYILDRRLRADGLKVAVFRQERNTAEWRDATTTKDTALKLENAILQRARELRLNTLGE